MAKLPKSIYIKRADIPSSCVNKIAFLKPELIHDPNTVFIQPRETCTIYANPWPSENDGMIERYLKAVEKL
jgi:hypothetical protein